MYSTKPLSNKKKRKIEEMDKTREKKKRKEKKREKKKREKKIEEMDKASAALKLYDSEHHNMDISNKNLFSLVNMNGDQSFCTRMGIDYNIYNQLEIEAHGHFFENDCNTINVVDPEGNKYIVYTYSNLKYLVGVSYKKTSYTRETLVGSDVFPIIGDNPEGAFCPIVHKVLVFLKEYAYNPIRIMEEKKKREMKKMKEMRR